MTQLSASVGKIVAVLALLPPFVLIYLVSGRRGLRDGWPLAVVGALSYILGQFPTSQYFGPYLPDIVGALVSFGCILLLLRFWRPRTVLGYGGVPLTEATATATTDVQPEAGGERQQHSILAAVLPFIILIAVVVLWTGPWKFTAFNKTSLAKVSLLAVGSISHKSNAGVSYSLLPFVAGTAILVSWLIMLALIRPSIATIGQVFRRTFQQMWGALLVGVFIFGLAYVFNFSGMASSLAYAFSKIGPTFIVLAPILGWIGVALSGSNTSTNTMFGLVQKQVGGLLGFPVLLLPSLGSVGAEVGKPVAPQTASVGVSTSKYVRNEGQVIRHNMGWTLVMLGWLIIVGLLFYFFLPSTMLK